MASYILTKSGQEKAQKISQDYNDCQIAKKTKLHRHTVSKIINSNNKVRFRTLEDFFSPFKFDLEKQDYEEFQNDNKTTIRNTGDYYVKRPSIEQQVYESLLSPNYILRIKAPKKMGKTILIKRVLKKLKGKENYPIVSISFQEADNSHLSELNELLRWLCANVSSQLKLPVQLDNWNNSNQELGSKMTCINYFEKYLLPKLKYPMVLFLDNLELLFRNENISQDFLGMLRSWNDRASINPLWQKLRLVISYAPNVEIKMNPNQSPFNIGTAIELPEFTLEEVQKLAEIYQLNLNIYQVRELTKMVGGHPYLVELTFRNLKTRNNMTLEKILETAPTKDGIYHSPHLQEYLAILKQNPDGVLKEYPDLAKYFLKIIKGEDIANIKSDVIKTLMNLGLVKDKDGKILVGCELYRLYFESYLGDVE
ncbi:MAG: molecular chaperone Tir [Okeania sp. SIO2F4]|uniref:AAA-like domain-containing protein n=1 Tax=Okeania sp. SIO2F4 TaxID=2607790 RepID=UPI00142B84C7|nr:AAA-like domain-containing protein [Okeania sp. SIO2F4]NES03895.1 molecular chaperone Tir [Okeania sp. SIO2F4]